ncbi:MAG: efflux RND transporter periplasmic adaptor subunit [Planctomycetes bacterium]|nr:efflux RND transporter periplasmic adaptor subunit [Planctomycetota bacterium]
MPKANDNQNALEFKGRTPILGVCMNLGLIMASALAGWIWITVVSTGGASVWFFIVAFCGVLLGIAIHQLITRGRWCLTLLCLAAFVGSTVAAHSSGLSEQKPLASKPREPIFVQTEEVPPKPFTEQFTFSGVIEPDRSALLAFAAGGLIKDLYVEDNDRVQAGQILAQLNTDQLMASLEEAKAVCNRAESNRKRLEKLFTQQATSEILRDNAIADDLVARARVKALNVRIEDMTLKAPFAGQIAVRFAEQGEYASPGKPVFKLLLLDPVKAVMGVPEKMIGLIRPNASATVFIDALDAEARFKGHVTMIPPETAEDSPLYAVEITIPNESGRLRPGMAARISVQGSTYENTTVLKTSWVQHAGDEHFIFQLEPLEHARDDFLAENALAPEQLEETIALVATPAHVGIAAKVVLKDYFIHDGNYVVRDLRLDHPVVTRGAYMLKNLSMVRTGILKQSKEVIENHGESH